MVVRLFAQQGNAIIVGRGEVYLTQDLPQNLHLRLISNLEFRLNYFIDAFKLQKQDASAYLESHQRLREEFLSHYTQTDPYSPEHYHLAFNNSRWSPAQIAELAEHFLKLKMTWAFYNLWE